MKCKRVSKIFNVDLEELSVEEMIMLIRKSRQMAIYTVNEGWNILLFNLETCANDECDCEYETQSLDLKGALYNAIEYIAEYIHEESH